MDFEALWADDELRRRAIATMILFVGVIVGRFLLLRAARRMTASARKELRLSWSNSVKRSAITLLVAGAAVIWSEEIQTVALSLVAVAVALVVAVKELLLCVSGSLLRTSARTFAIGDRIEVNGIRGDVVDHGLLATTVLEIGPGHRRTGRTVVVPNSVFLSSSVINETATKQFVLHTIDVPLAGGADWREAERRLLAAANEACDEYIEPALQHLDAASSQHGLTTLSVEPRVLVGLAGADQVVLHLRVPTKARKKGIVEQSILRGFLEAASTPPKG